MRQFWNIMSGIYAKYHVQIMLLFVYTTTRNSFVIFTCRYFKLSWNTTALSQSICRNFSCISIKLVMFCFPSRGPRELYPLSFHELCVHMRLNKTKFERNSSLEYYHMTCIGKTKHTGLRGLLVILMHVSLCQFFADKIL